MRVTAWSNGKKTFGVRVGTPNRDQFFERDWDLVRLELDGEEHEFMITGGFWNQCPEIRDRGRPLLREWLQRHRTLDWPRGRPPEAELLPLGGNRFRLIP